MYGHGPKLSLLTALPTEAERWESMLRPLKDRYADIPEVLAATNPRDMLLALYNLSTTFLRGEARPGAREERIENYTRCADDYHTLHREIYGAIGSATSKRDFEVQAEPCHAVRMLALETLAS